MVHGLYNGLTSMGHGWYNTVVQHCMAHDPWDFVTLALPMTHGKKSMNGLGYYSSGTAPWKNLYRRRVTPRSVMWVCMPVSMLGGA